MAFSFFLNMEQLALEIAKQHIECMTDENHQLFDGIIDDIYLDFDVFKNNLSNGFVAITQLSCYIESFINTILNSCINYQGETLLKKSIDEKIEIIFLYYHKDFSSIKKTHYYESYRIATRIRNELIHFKHTYVCESSWLTNFEICKQPVAVFFTKKHLTKIYNNYISLCKLIASTLELTIHENVDIFACDGKDTIVNYVMNSDILPLDAYI